MKKLRIALLSGGFSAEREVSIKTGEMIAKNLDRKKYQVFLFDPKDELENFIVLARRKKFEVVFPALHGTFGEDGTVQGVLELLGLPYVFSGVLASSLAIDKEMTKRILIQQGINMPKHEVFHIEKKEIDFDIPAVVKPVRQGSSIGVTIVKDKRQLDSAIRDAFKYDSKIIAEEFIDGREITAAVLGNKNLIALPLIEIRPKVSFFFDYRAKYEIGGSKEICPAPISRALTKKIQDTAIKVHKILGCRGVTRSDFILKGHKPYFLEINTIPGMTETSLVPQAAAKAKIPFPKLLDKLIELAMEK